MYNSGRTPGSDAPRSGCLQRQQNQLNDVVVLNLWGNDPSLGVEGSLEYLVTLPTLGPGLRYCLEFWLGEMGATIKMGGGIWRHHFCSIPRVVPHFPGR